MDENEEVVEFDYIPYLLDNLSILKRDIKIELKITSVTLSEISNDGSLKTFHFSVVVRVFGAARSSVTFMASYLTPESKRIKKPYVEYHNLQFFLDFLEGIFESHNVDNVLGKIQMIKKSELREEELDIFKIKLWNP